MYSREMGGVRSDGQLYAMQRELQKEVPIPETERPPDTPTEPRQEPKQSGFLSDLLPETWLRDWKIDDLLFLAACFLLFADPEGKRNDLLLLLIGLLLFF